MCRVAGAMGIPLLAVRYTDGAPDCAGATTAFGSRSKEYIPPKLLVELGVTILVNATFELSRDIGC